MRHFYRGLSVALTCFALTAAMGCGVGEDRVLFVTLSGIMINADSQPPALDIGYTRQEGVYSAAFQKGQVPPVLTTIGSEQGAFNLKVDQSYATGDAALMMAKEFSSVDNPCSDSDPSHLCPPVSSQRLIHSTPAPTNLWDDFLSFFAVGGSDRHPYFFGTDTSIGLHVAWGTGTVPRAVSIGYKRKELSLVPLIETRTDKANASECQPTLQVDNEVCVKLPSLIATSATGAQVSTQTNTGLQVNQTFASGDAATYLASDPHIRIVLGPQLVGQNVRQFQSILHSQGEMLDSIKSTWDKGAHHTADEVVGKAGEIFARKFDKSNFISELTLFGGVGAPDSTKKLKALQQYISGQ